MLWGKEIHGMECSRCGSTLLATREGAYCDWCEVVIPYPEQIDMDTDDELFGVYDLLEDIDREVTRQKRTRRKRGQG